MNKITIAEFAKRQGISKAKAYAMAEDELREYVSIEEGIKRKVGRPKAQAGEAFYKAVEAWRSGEITAKEAMERAEMTRTTFYKIVREEGL